MTPLLDASSQEMTRERELCYRIEWESAFKGYDTIDASSATASSGVTNGVLMQGKAATNGKATTNGPRSPPFKRRRQSPAVNIANGVTSQTIPLETTPVTIIGDVYSQAQLVFTLLRSIEYATGNEPDIGTLEEVNLAGKLCIVVSELEQPLLGRLKGKLKAVVQVSCDSRTWVASGILSGQEVLINLEFSSV